MEQPSRFERALGHPAALLTTVLVLLMTFGWTFLADAGRAAPSDDPAYYSWRTEALIANDPATLIEVTGPLDMYSGGYRVATPVLAGFLKQVGGLDTLTPTVLLAIGLRVVIPLLLAGFAFRHRRDPLLWHIVALGSASLLLFPPFAGYIDNMLTLLFLAASLFLLEGVRTSWGARIVFASLLWIAGMTHPTTLVIFVMVLGAMSLWRLVVRRFDIRSVWRDDSALLLSAGAAVVVTYLSWKVGIWGPGAALSDAALPPPAPASFFKQRLSDWVVAMRPALNGTMFALGVVALFVRGRKALDSDLTRVSLLWLAPLVGVLGFLAGVAYPYYRFFNTTLAWVLLISLGMYLLARLGIAAAARGGAARVALLALPAVALLIVTNIFAGFRSTHWNDPADAWIKPAERVELERVRAELELEPGERPVIFVVDNAQTEDVRIYGEAKRAGNVTRYAVPPEQQDRTGYFLGSVEDLADRQPTGSGYHGMLSQESLSDVEPLLDDAPVIVVPRSFNEGGANADLVEAVEVSDRIPGSVVWVADGQTLRTAGVSTERLGAGGSGGSFPDLLLGLFAVAAMCLPGFVLFRALLPADGWWSALGVVPAFGAASLIAVSLVVLGILRAPFGIPLALVCLALAAAGSAALLVWGRRSLRTAATPAR